MTTSDFNAVFDAQFNRCADILVNKAKEYATDDRLHNFKVAGNLQGCDPIRALSGMMAKHTVSIYDMCDCKNTYSMAMWDEKITDHINYLILLKALVVEKAAMEEKEKTNWHLNDRIDLNPELLKFILSKNLPYSKEKIVEILNESKTIWRESERCEWIVQNIKGLRLCDVRDILLR